MKYTIGAVVMFAVAFGLAVFGVYLIVTQGDNMPRTFFLPVFGAPLAFVIGANCLRLKSEAKPIKHALARRCDGVLFRQTASYFYVWLKDRDGDAGEELCMLRDNVKKVVWVNDDAQAAVVIKHLNGRAKYHLYLSHKELESATTHCEHCGSILSAKDKPCRNCGAMPTQKV